MQMFFPFNTLVAELLLGLYFILIFLFLTTANITASHFQGVTSAMTASSTFIESMQLYNSTILSDGTSSLQDDGGDFYVRIGVYLWFLFGCLWLLASIMNIGWCAMAGAVSHWYFFRENEEWRTKIPLVRSLGRVFRYHLGSIFFGSFVIAVICLIRIILMIIDK